MAADVRLGLFDLLDEGPRFISASAAALDLLAKA